MKKYEILEHTADLKIRAFGKTKEELFLNMAQGMQAALRPKIKNKISPPKAGPPLVEKIKIIKVKSANLETLLVDFLSEILYLIQVNKEVYDEIKFLKFSDAEIKTEISGKTVESFGEDIKGVTYHDLEIKKNQLGIWQATVLFDI